MLDRNVDIAERIFLDPEARLSGGFVLHWTATLSIRARSPHAA
jgi:hypothetical protein